MVNTASMAAVTSGPLTAAYFMSKHAVMALSESLYLELRQKNAKIGVSVVCPELIATRIGAADRNRPLYLRRGDETASPERDIVENAIRSATQNQGIAPDVIAERTLNAIRADRFYVLAPEGTHGAIPATRAWMRSGTSATRGCRRARDAAERDRTAAQLALGPRGR